MEINEFKRLVLPFKEKLHKLSSVILNSNDEANDVLQEVFLKLWECKSKLAEVVNLEAYIVRMTKNLCIDKLRKSKRNIGISQHEYHLEYKEANPYVRIELRDSYSQMEKILNELPEKQRMVIYLRDVEGYSFEEIEEITGFNIKALRMTLSRARKSARVQYLKLNDYESN